MRNTGAHKLVNGFVNRVRSTRLGSAGGKKSVQPSFFSGLCSALSNPMFAMNDPFFGLFDLDKSIAEVFDILFGFSRRLHPCLKFSRMLSNLAKRSRFCNVLSKFNIRLNVACVSRNSKESRILARNYV